MTTLTKIELQNNKGGVGVTTQKEQKKRQAATETCQEIDKKAGLNKLIFLCTDFCACKMVLCTRLCTQNYVCIKRWLVANSYHTII